MIRISIIQIKMFDEVVRELIEVRYVPQLKKDLISVRIIESKGLKLTVENGILKVTKGCMVVMKAVRDRNLYCLKGSTVTRVLTALVNSDEDTIRFWHMRLGHTSEKSLQALTKQGLLKSAKTCKVEFCKHCILTKKIKVKFGTAIHYTKGILDYVHTNI